MYSVYSERLATRLTTLAERTCFSQVSASPTGPFRRLGLAVPAEAHNPVISRAADGTWLLWTCGCPNPGAPRDCARRSHNCTSGGKPAAWTTTVYSSASLDGPWEPGSNRYGVQGAHLNPLGLFLRTSIHFIWRILSAFLPA